MGNKLFEDAFLRAQMSHMSGFNNLCMKFAIHKALMLNIFGNFTKGLHHEKTHIV